MRGQGRAKRTWGQNVLSYVGKRNREQGREAGAGVRSGERNQDCLVASVCSAVLIGTRPLVQGFFGA